MFVVLCLWNWNVVFYNLFVGGNLMTMRRSKSQDASEIPNVAKVVYSCIWSVLLTIMTIKKDALLRIVKDKCHGFKYFQSSYVAHRQFKSLEVVNSFMLWQRSLSHFTHYNHHILSRVFILKYFCIKLFFKSIKLIPFSNLTWLGLSTSVVYYSLGTTFNLIQCNCYWSMAN